MKVYEAKLKKGTEVESFSLVLGAAVETKLSKFASEREKQVFFANEEKQIIYSVAMRPNKMIFRKDVNGEPANVFFSEETVEQIQQSYFKNNNAGKVKMNINHGEDKFEGVYPIESWIVNDPEIDKSKTLMMEDVKKGDLIIGYKIENQDVWEKFVKTGEVDGLSVEAFLDYEINDKSNMSTEKEKSFLKKLRALFMEDMPKEEEMAVDPDIETPEMMVKKWEEKYNLLMAENADLKEKLAQMEGSKVASETELETMKAENEKFKAEKEQAVTDLAKFKAEKEAVKDSPKEEAVPYEKMSNYQKAKFNRGKL